MNVNASLPCNPANYRRASGEREIKYIVVHYTAGSSDTAADNALYFSRTRGLGASAHYFVDEGSVYLSVPEEHIAWHCGSETGVYTHPECRNQNSLGVELCSRVSGGEYYFPEKTVRLAAELVGELMERFNIPSGNVLRHFDVTGKICPAPFVNLPESWSGFRQRLINEEESMTQETFNSLMQGYLDDLAQKQPQEWSAKARAWAEEAGVIRGDEEGGSRYRSFLTREELAQALYRLASAGPVEN